MTHLAILPFRGVGGQEGEGKVRFRILHQMEENSFRYAQVLAFFRQVHFHCSVVPGDFLGENR